jgi:hypothetical protein
MNLSYNKQRQADFTKKHTLTKQDLQKLIQAKLNRAKEYHSALKKREALSVESR